MGFTKTFSCIKHNANALTAAKCGWMYEDIPKYKKIKIKNGLLLVYCELFAYMQHLFSDFEDLRDELKNIILFICDNNVIIFRLKCANIF